MDTRQYVDCFEQLRGMSIKEQEAALEEAHHQAVVNLRLSPKTTLSQTLSYFITITIALLPPFILGFSLTINAIFLGIGLVVSGFVTDAFQRSSEVKMLKQGLEQTKG